MKDQMTIRHNVSWRHNASPDDRTSDQQMAFGTWLFKAILMDYKWIMTIQIHLLSVDTLSLSNQKGFREILYQCAVNNSTFNPYPANTEND